MVEALDLAMQFAGLMPECTASQPAKESEILERL
jgi:hypothetical protein